jgi:hypothetical protein
LPESHECLFVGTYTDPTYSAVKRQKSREVQSVKAGIDPDSGRRYVPESSGGRMGTRTFWEGSSKVQTAFYGGIILGLAAAFRILVSSFTVDIILLFVLTLLLGGIGFVIVLKSRESRANEVGVFTSFVIWPLGIAITLITSLIGFTFYTFGYFTNSGSSVHAEAEVAKRSIYTFAGLAIGFKLFAYLLLLGPGQAIILSLIGALLVSSTMFLWYGLIMMIPWSILDGAKLYAADSRSFWMHLAGMVVLLILNGAF